MCSGEQGIEDMCYYLSLDITKFTTLETRAELEPKYIPQFSRKALKLAQQITNEDLRRTTLYDFRALAVWLYVSGMHIIPKRIVFHYL